VIPDITRLIPWSSTSLGFLRERTPSVKSWVTQRYESVGLKLCTEHAAIYGAKYPLMSSMTCVVFVTNTDTFPFAPA
jgi:hypothetical protein